MAINGLIHPYAYLDIKLFHFSLFNISSWIVIANVEEVVAEVKCKIMEMVCPFLTKPQDDVTYASPKNLKYFLRTNPIYSTRETN